MEIQLKTSDVKLKLNIDGKIYELSKPKLGELKLIDKARENGQMLEVMQKVLESSGLPAGLFDQLEVDHLMAIMNALSEMITPKKN